MGQIFCQSCGMPLSDKSQFGTESDGSLSEEYCVYCYKDGNFVFEGDMEQMIAVCVPHVVQSHKEMTESEAEQMMRKILPRLWRWKKPISREELEGRASSLLESCFTIVLSSITAEGYPRGCALVRVANEGFSKIYVATSASSRKVAQFRDNPKAGISFANDTNGATLLGTVRIMADSDERTAYWQDWMKDYFPLGPTDPDFCVLEFTTLEATLYIDGEFETYRY